MDTITTRDFFAIDQHEICRWEENPNDGTHATYRKKTIYIEYGFPANVSMSKIELDRILIAGMIESYEFKPGLGNPYSEILTIKIKR